ncbi:MAG: tetratricopeptide repeat protein [Spirochaetales bacterium]|jgi:tetratricopeptide (TPR) repeat protein|nr:tetratricopeptide repeat protein [Spirochaetales bacterium]
MKSSCCSRLQIFFFVILAAARSGAQEFPPSHPVSIYRQASAARADGDYYRAIELFREALTKNPSYFDAVLSLAEIYFQLEEYDQALDLSKKALALSPASAAARVLQGRILIGTGEAPAAQKIFEAILREQPNNIEARLAMAELDIAGGKNRNAVNEYLETLQISPQNRKALLSLALIQQAAGNTSAAADYFDMAVRFHGDTPLTRLLAGEFYLAGGNLAAARRHAGIALTLNPDYEAAYMLLGQIELLEGKYPAVYTTMDTILKLNRNNPAAWYLKAMAALYMGNPKDAITLLRTLLSLGQENEIARITLEDTLREFFPAEDPLRKEFADYHFVRGGRFRERNLFSRAYEEYRRGLQLNPYSPEGRKAFADIIEKLGYYARSYAVMQFLEAQKMADEDILESLEMGESFLEDSVSREWNIDQLLVPRRKFSLSLFFDLSSSNLIHRSSGIYLTRYFSDLLSGSPLLAPPALAIEVKNYGEAFQEARQRESDYFLILTYSETSREFVIKADLYLSRTGGKIDSFQVYRTGNDRVQNSLTRMISDLSSRFPLRGELLQREFERGLVNLGRVDGIKEEERLLIVPRNSLSLKHDRLEFSWKPEDILGNFTIKKIDDMVAEGVVNKNGFFDRINPGDTIFRDTRDEKNPEQPLPAVPDRPLFKLIQSIQ